MPARILDDLAVCPRRAYYSMHRESYRPRRMRDLEDSEERGYLLVSELLLSLEEMGRKGSFAEVLTSSTHDDSYPRILLKDPGSGGSIALGCKPDLSLFLLLNTDGYSRIVSLAVEAADTDASEACRRRHILPRLILYSVCLYYCYGAPSVTIYVSLSPFSKPPALLVVPSKDHRQLISRIIRNISSLLAYSSPPKPSKNPPCSHCLYRSICEAARH